MIFSFKNFVIEFQEMPLKDQDKISRPEKYSHPQKLRLYDTRNNSGHWPFYNQLIWPAKFLIHFQWDSSVIAYKISSDA